MRAGDTAEVVVVGSINADTTYRLAALPRPGETAIARSASVSAGGKGANQAIAAAAAGARTRMVGLVGADADADAALRSLRERGVDTDDVGRVAGATTGRAVIAVDDEGENSILVLSGANALVEETAVVAGLSALSAGDALVLQNEVPAGANHAAARRGREVGATVIWNAAPAPITLDELVLEADVLVVNAHELDRIAALLDVDRDTASFPDPPLELLRRTAVALSPSGRLTGVCTLGSDGAVFVAADASGRVRAPRVRAVDTTAAGDTVVGYLAASQTAPLEERLLLAAAAGAVTVTRAGASSSIPALREVEQLLATTTERTDA
ncbi:ribokinase [Rathayibacter sp. VKM Ac-2929]|uniref:ribokinase n=1 Tax=Rathayibacter sp. VKM Ac-2929 TaxID=2929480 RepID=UPI001FB4B88A|nr:ribokinase [Rathayibacter sp. VKM Ac-2929]MCJ1675575.1 ribokinase [Rathayibacter sp. VKM Ac-2929]